MRDTGNKRTETIRHAIEDPMNMFVESKSQARQDKYARVEQLKVSFCPCVWQLNIHSISSLVIACLSPSDQILMEDIRREEAARKKRKQERHARENRKPSKKHKHHKSSK